MQVDDLKYDRNQDAADVASNNIDNDLEEDIFAGGYEDYIEQSFYAETFSTNDQDMLEFSSVVKPKRTQLFKTIISRPKREFESSFNFIDEYPGEEGPIQNYEIKQRPVNEYQMNDRAFLEIGLQTANESVVRGYQVPKMRMNNSYTQVEKGMVDVIKSFEKIGNSYLTNPNKVQEIVNFLNRVRSRMEEALQSNETIDIFQNDFDLDRTTQVKSDEEKKEKKMVLRTFKDDNYLIGSKSKKEKNINCIRILSPYEVFIAHSLIRNLTTEERIKVIGIPYNSNILFWNFDNLELNSPVFVLEIPNEITVFEFCPTNVNKLVCALYSGQIIVYEFKDLLGILHRYTEGETPINQRKNDKKHLYEFYISHTLDSHKTHINAMKWFPEDFQMLKGNFVNKVTNEVQLLTTIAEDGTVLIWDLKRLADPSKNDFIPYNMRPVHRVEINKIDSLSKICGTGIELNTKTNPSMFKITTDEGLVYTVDWLIKNSQENLTANIKKVYNSRYYRPILSIQNSPFYNYIFLTLHDYHFCLWTEHRSKPIFQSPNLKKSFYTCAKFSPSKPSVVFLTRNNGWIDIWDFIDESHKHSVREKFNKESITSLLIFQYYSPIDEEETNVKRKYTEYLAIGDLSGQLTLMEVPKMFSGIEIGEEKMMEDFLLNEIKRQEYMEMRYKTIDEEATKPDNDDTFNSEKFEHDEHEYKALEDIFTIEKNNILEELSLINYINKLS